MDTAVLQYWHVLIVISFFIYGNNGTNRKKNGSIFRIIGLICRIMGLIFRMMAPIYKNNVERKKHKKKI